MRSNENNSGIVIISSDKNVSKILVSWNSSTNNKRKLLVYGKKTAYSNASDLYDGSKQGEQIGTIAYGTTSFTVNGEYPYIGIRSSSGALYLDSVGFQFESSDVAVTGVTLDQTETQTINVGGKVAFTATVAPNNATDKKVKWSVGGTNADAVTLYTDEACTAGNEVGTAATDVLTVYAKGVSAGSATVTATSNADSTKTASCGVNVTQPKTDISGATVTVDTTTGTVSVSLDGTPVTSGYNVEYIKQGETTGSSTFPTEGGKYTAKITPAEGSSYIGEKTVDFVIDKLIEGTHKIATTKNSSPYTRFFFVVKKSELQGVKKAQFTVTKGGNSMTASSTKYYTGSTLDGVKYTPASSDYVLFTVSVTGTDSEGLECRLDLIK